MLALRLQGWHVTKRGWPDFACFETESGQFAVVECKRSATSPLTQAQSAIMDALGAAGIPCYRYDPVDGFTSISGHDISLLKVSSPLGSVDSKDHLPPQPR
jgi:hypothetical protein